LPQKTVKRAGGSSGGPMESPYLYWAAAIAIAAVLIVLLFSTYQGGLVGG